MPCVVDASVALSWCFEDEKDEAADTLLDLLGREPAQPALAPAIWPAEVANALRSGERRGRIQRTQARAFLRYFSTLAIRLEPPRLALMGDLLDFAHKHDLSVYDASYLELAMRERLPLASLDRRLIEAAKSAKVPLFSP